VSQNLQSFLLSVKITSWLIWAASFLVFSNPEEPYEEYREVQNTAWLGRAVGR
jgi:hypothetical protein